MIKCLLVFAVCSAALCALEPGKNYDFIQKNGQNVLGAELIEETEKIYVVRLKYVPKPIRLTKENLVEIPVLSKIQAAPAAKKLELRRDFVLSASAGFSYLTFGQLASIFRTGYEARLGADWQLFEKPFLRLSAVSVVATFAAYQSAPRRIQLASGYLGPKILVWNFEKLGAALFVSPLIGVSYTDLKGYTFASNYAALSAAGILSFEKRCGTLAFAAQLYVNSLFDSSLNFSSTGISVAARYPLGSAASY